MIHKTKRIKKQKNKMNEYVNTRQTYVNKSEE